MKKTVIGAIVVVAVGVAAYVLIGGRGRSESPFRTSRIDRGDITATVSATGTLSAVTTVQVGSQVSGIISRLYADFNSRVRKGQLLAELDPTPFEQAVAQRRADLENSRVTAANTKIAFARQQKLLAEGLAAQADYDNAKAAADSAAAQVKLSEAALAQAETNYKYSKIYSPVDGIVVNRAYDVGQTVAASFQAPTLFTIAQDLTKMQVQADVDESDIGRIRAGQVSHFTVDAYPDRTFTAAVSQIRLNATVNQNVVTYPVMIFIDNPDERLRPSMTANVTVDVASVRDVLRLPNAALRFKPDPSQIEGAAGAGKPRGGGPRPGGSGASGPAGKGGGAVVYVPARDGKVRPVRVKTGVTDGQFTELVDGELAEGSDVVTGMATTRSGDQPAMRMRF